MSDRCRLYLITPPKLRAARAFAEDIEDARSTRGDVASLQLRLKDVGDDDIRRAAEMLMPIAQRAGAAFILNDRPDLARELGCDGVHVGQDDATYAEARAAVGANAHRRRHLPQLAPSRDRGGGSRRRLRRLRRVLSRPPTKEPQDARADIELLHWWAEMMVVPCVAIGGITVENAKPLIEAGADFLAVSSGVWAHEKGAAAAVKAFNALFS